MANILRIGASVVYNVFLFAITKFTVFFWKLAATIGFVFGFPRVQRRRPREIDLARYEENSEYLGSVYLTRHDTWDETFIYSKCYNFQWEEIFKTLLHEKRGDGARRDFYTYAENSEEGMVEGIRVPCPISVDFLDRILNCRHE